MIAAKKCHISGEMLLDGMYSTGRGIANSHLLRVSPMTGEYKLFQTSESVWIIHEKYIKSKLEYTKKELSQRACGFYRKVIREYLNMPDDNARDIGVYAVLLDDNLNEMCRLPISLDDNLGLNIEVARKNGRIVALRITKKKKSKKTAGRGKQ